ncbi:MAG: hypothetical protein JO154_06980 [Chitinophaga sp.]|uniref:hypothetical protein n=1 Tax=Chitinophaga sp. TaxID=1869181 RepID=UPI0025BA37A0|nr:hypothetical protein [Chitinophaga sp.]MBV8252335.1 hypothetical protein [Chitinophaga sp.]
MRVLLLSAIALLLTTLTYGQKIYQIRADSVRIYNQCDTAELILENHTKNVSGFLFNKGLGRTEFQRLRLVSPGRGLIAIPGQDTLDFGSSLNTWGDERYDQLNTNFLTISEATLWQSWPAYKVVGYDAYDVPDMPPLSDQAFQGKGNNRYYNGLIVRDGDTGFDFAINWNGELQGPNGAFIRTKDDTKPAWSNWRELVFKDYVDNNFVKKISKDTVVLTSTVVRMKENTPDARMGLVTVDDGVTTYTINTTAITSTSRIMLTVQSGQPLRIGAGPAAVPTGIMTSVVSRVPGTSFTISVAHGAGPAEVAWLIAEPY